VLLGKLHGIPTPYNHTLQRVVNEFARTGKQPGGLTVAQLQVLVKEGERACCCGLGQCRKILIFRTLKKRAFVEEKAPDRVGYLVSGWRDIQGKEPSMQRRGYAPVAA
jgi:hypothetical protein